MDTTPAIPLASDQLYWSRPSQAHLRALNLAAFELFNRKQPSLAILSSSFYAVEMIKRSPYPITIAGSGAFDPHLFAEHMSLWAWGEIIPARLEKLDETFHSIFWAEPLAASGERLVPRLKTAAMKGCTLEVITSTGLGEFLPGRDRKRTLRTENLKAGKVIRLLRHNGWIVDKVVPFNGPRAFFWQRLGVVFQKLGWLAWSDRCYQTLKNQIRDPAWAWPLASLALIRARLP